MFWDTMYADIIRSIGSIYVFSVRTWRERVSVFSGDALFLYNVTHNGDVLLLIEGALLVLVYVQYIALIHVHVPLVYCLTRNTFCPG